MNNCIKIRISLILKLIDNFKVYGRDIMKFLIFISIGFIFCIIQIIQSWISSKLKKAWIKSAPIGITIIGLLYCFILYLSFFWTSSPSVIGENRYFALFLATLFGTAFVGCLIGGIIFRLFSRLNKQS